MVFETILHSDLQKLVQVEQLTGNLFSADNGGNKITVEILDGGVPATVSGAVYGYVIREDGKTVVIEGSLSGNRASITLPTSAYAVIGWIDVVIKVGNTTAGACRAYVYRTTTDVIVDPGSVVPDISELLAQIGACEQATTAATAAATAAGYVNVTSSKSGKVITIVTTNRNNQSTSTTITEPTMTVSESGGVVTVTCTDADGTTTVSFDATDIDDTAGAGDTDKIWSADKSAKEFAGEHDDLTAGNAEQILGSTTEDKAPYNYRAVPVKSRRVREKKIVGGTVAWNQLVKNGNFENTSTFSTYRCTLSVQNNIATVTSTDNSDGNIYTSDSEAEKVVDGHKYLCSISYKPSGSNNARVRIRIGDESITDDSTSQEWKNVSGIIQGVVSETRKIVQVEVYAYTNGGITNCKNIQVFDLTAMFGSTIADALYAMETATPGSGVAWFRSLFPKDYYAYDAGSLQSVQAKEKKTYDANDTLIETYPLDSSLVLRGIPKLDSNNNLYYDGDEYESSGNVTRNWGYENSFTRGSADSSGKLYTIKTISDMETIDTTNFVKLFNNLLPVTYLQDARTQADNGIKTLTAYGNAVYAGGFVGNESALDTLLQSLELLYPLATPTTEFADPFRELQICDPDGTEEFVDAGVSASTPTRDVAIPVGHISEYYKDIVSAIEGIPDAPSSNGTYVLKVTVASGVPTYSWVSE